LPGRGAGVSGRRRFLERIPSIRAKLGFVIVFAVGMTVLLIYLLLGYALSNSSRDSDRLELLETAQQATKGRPRDVPAGVRVLLLSTGGRWSWGEAPPGLPRFGDRAVHVGS